MRLSETLISRLGPPAARRRVATDELALRIVEIVAEDGLVDAVLDDVDESRPATTDPRLRRLRSALDDAKARIAELEDILFSRELELPVKWGLTRREAQILRVLLAVDDVTKDQLWTALYDADASIEITVIESHICKIRRKTEPFGLLIEGRRYLGYRLADRQSWRDRLGGQA